MLLVALIVCLLVCSFIVHACVSSVCSFIYLFVSLLVCSAFILSPTVVKARSELLGSVDRDALLLLLALHHSAFDRAAPSLGLPHPLYDEAAKRLIQSLGRDAAARVRAARIEELARPVLALAQLRALDRRALKALDERLLSGRLLSLPPSSFVSIVYAHRLVRGPVPKEELRRPLCLAFGALQHSMEPKQIETYLSLSFIVLLAGPISSTNTSSSTVRMGGICEHALTHMLWRGCKYLT